MDRAADYYQQDVIVPAAIFHGCDFGNPQRSDGEAPDYLYNFIDYYFEAGDEEIFARHYLDLPGEVNLNLESTQLDSPLAEKVMLFLSLRYASITCSGGEALPEEVMRSLHSRWVKHIQDHGI